MFTILNPNPKTLGADFIAEIRRFQALAEKPAFRPPAETIESKALQDATQIIKKLYDLIEFRHRDEDVLDSMLIWEEMSNNKALMEQLPGIGAEERRQYVISELRPFVVEWFEYAQNELLFDGSFDCEFAPPFLANLRTIIVDDITEIDILKALRNMAGVKLLKKREKITEVG